MNGLWGDGNARRISMVSDQEKLSGSVRIFVLWKVPGFRQLSSGYLAIKCRLCFFGSVFSPKILNTREPYCEER